MRTYVRNITWVVAVLTSAVALALQPVRTPNRSPKRRGTSVTRTGRVKAEALPDQLPTTRAPIPDLLRELIPWPQGVQLPAGSSDVRLTQNYGAAHFFTQPLVPDTNRHVFSVGLGGTFGNGKYTWDIAYQYAYGPERHVSNGTLASGDYHFQSNAVSISLGHEF